MLLCLLNKITFLPHLFKQTLNIFHVIRLTAPPRINLLTAEIMQKELGGKINVFQHSHSQQVMFLYYNISPMNTVLIKEAAISNCQEVFARRQKICFCDLNSIVRLPLWCSCSAIHSTACTEVVGKAWTQNPVREREGFPLNPITASQQSFLAANTWFKYEYECPCFA